MNRRAKIIATIGPASQDVATLEKLISEGLDVARVNMSHGTHDDHQKSIENIRQAASNVNKEVAILMDLQGPKIRTGRLENPLVLRNGEMWFIGTSEYEGSFGKKYIPTIYEHLVRDCHDGAMILFDDGLIQAKAICRKENVYEIEIIVGGTLKSSKGINLPDCNVSASSFTEKDQKDLLFGLKYNVDYVALSFVKNQEDIIKVRSFLKKINRDIPIIAKIERVQAIEQLDKICQVSDAVMVARGDMGVELGNHNVPSLQKKIINEGNSSHLPVITATQMLESMTENPTPTRAEASDVANAIWDGTDAVMLSEETAVGKYPVETIKMMNKIIEQAERTPKIRPFLRDIDLSDTHAAIMVASSVISEKINAKKILSITERGISCLNISVFRPTTPVIGITNSIKTSRKIALYWGIEPFYIPNYDKDNADFQRDVIIKVQEKYGLKKGDSVIITRGDGSFFSNESSNSVKVHHIDEGPSKTL